MAARGWLSAFRTVLLFVGTAMPGPFVSAHPILRVQPPSLKNDSIFTPYSHKIRMWCSGAHELAGSLPLSRAGFSSIGFIASSPWGVSRMEPRMAEWGEGW